MFLGVNVATPETIVGGGKNLQHLINRWAEEIKSKVEKDDENSVDSASSSDGEDSCIEINPPKKQTISQTHSSIGKNFKLELKSKKSMVKHDYFDRACRKVWNQLPHRNPFPAFNCKITAEECHDILYTKMQTIRFEV